MPAKMENTAVATGLEKVSFRYNPKEKKCQIMLKLLHMGSNSVYQFDLVFVVNNA